MKMSGKVLLGAVVLSLSMMITATAVAEPVEPTVVLQQETATKQNELVAICDSYCVGVPNSANLLDLAKMVGTCAQMPYQFTTQVAQATGLMARNVACAGATIQDVRTGKNGEPSQLDALGPRTKQVIVRIGGNNVGLTPSGVCFMLLFDCVRDDWLIKRAYGEVDPSYGIASLPGPLDSLFGDIKSRIAPGVVVLVVGYPPVVARQPGNIQDILCQAFISPAERQVIANLQDDLNGQLRSAAGRSGFTYVDPMAPTSPFMQLDTQGNNLDACSTSPAKTINLAGLTTTPLHPTKAGVDADAQLITPYALAS